MVICLERGADLHTAQLIRLPLTVSCFSKIQIGFSFLVPAHLGSPGRRAVRRLCACVRVCVCVCVAVTVYIVRIVFSIDHKCESGPTNYTSPGSTKDGK